MKLRKTVGRGTERPDPLIGRLKERRRRRRLEIEAEIKRLRAGFARMAAMPDDPPGNDEAFFRAIDDVRPDRPLFEGRY